MTKKKKKKEKTEKRGLAEPDDIVHLACYIKLDYDMISHVV